MKITSGFVFGELLVVLAIIATLFAIGVVNLMRLQPRATLTSFVPTIVADLKDQQIKAMLGGDHGVVFSSDSYTLFYGVNYNPSDPTNVAIPAPSPLLIVAVTFPSSQVVFQKGSGDIAGFVPGANTVTIGDTVTGNQQTITVNRFGVVSSVQ